MKKVLKISTIVVVAFVAVLLCLFLHVLKIISSLRWRI